MHVLFDLYGIDYDVLNDNFYLKQVYKVAIEKSGAEIRKYQEELFDPSGVTFTYILSESHASCHTWPSAKVEENVIGALQGCIHTCGEHVDPNIAVDYIIEILKPKEVYRQVIIRGIR
jgi:S-adenosylmethionine decarboxylase